MPLGGTRSRVYLFLDLNFINEHILVVVVSGRK